MTVMTGKHAMMEMLRAEGVKYVFGNPGTSESAMMDAIEHYPDLEYVLVTQEGVAVGMADSYGRATGKPSFLNLHIETGLANAISLMHNAYEGGSPMVVTSGNKDIRELAHERTDLAAMVEQFTKWTAEATYPEQVPFFLRRAFNEAKTPPTGPTFVGFSANSMDNEADVDIFASPEGYHRTAPDAQAVEKAAGILAEASNPLMILSDRIAQSGASDEAVRVAELLGCPVHTTIMHSEFNFPESHPQFRGGIRLAYPEAEETVNKADAVLLVGKMATGYYMFSKPRLDYFGPNTKLIHVDTDPTQVGTTQRTEVGIVADPKVTLADLAEALDAGMSGTAREAAKGQGDGAGRGITGDALGVGEAALRALERLADDAGADGLRDRSGCTGRCNHRGRLGDGAGRGPSRLPVRRTTELLCRTGRGARMGYGRDTRREAGAS